MTRPALATHMFALVVLRHEDRYLVVHEAKHGQSWYLPAGRVEPGEDLAAAAIRETIEEGGISPRLLGILRIDHECSVDARQRPSSRLRVVFFAEPAGTFEPKARADRHSLEARWVAPSELRTLELRHPEVAWLIDSVEHGAPVLPLAAYLGESVSAALLD